MRRNTLALILAGFVFFTLLYYLLYEFLFNLCKPLSNKSIANVVQHDSRTTLHIALVTCGPRIQETLVLIKSALLFSQATKEILYFWIFAEAQLISSFKEKLNDWQTFWPNFNFELQPLRFPPNHEKEWHSLFKPCASQRLFLPSVLQSVDSLLYVDTDIIFLSPVSDIWQFFKRFNATQLVALTPEHEDENIGWYNRFARHPYYGHLGVNSGVMLMNLTRMREFNWESHVLPIYKEYKLRITWGDQDIINILFYYNPEKLFLMPCEYNYRPDHCMYMSVCNASSEGIKIIHGNRGYFHSNKQPLFQIVYEAIESFKIGSDMYYDFLLPLQDALREKSVSESNCGKVSREATQVANKLFGNDYSNIKSKLKIDNTFH